MCPAGSDENQAGKTKNPAPSGRVDKEKSVRATLPTRRHRATTHQCEHERLAHIGTRIRGSQSECQTGGRPRPRPKICAPGHPNMSPMKWSAPSSAALQQLDLDMRMAMPETKRRFSMVHVDVCSAQLLEGNSLEVLIDGRAT